MEQFISVKNIVATLVYSFRGDGILFVSTVLFDWLTPKKLWYEIVEGKNQPLATVVAALIIAVGLIVAASSHG